MGPNGAGITLTGVLISIVEETDGVGDSGEGKARPFRKKNAPMVPIKIVARRNQRIQLFYKLKLAYIVM